MKIAKEKREKNKKAGNKQGIQFQIQSKIGASIIVVMAVIAVLVVVVVYNLLIKANNTELRQDSEAISLQVEKYFSPFERMVEQLALDEDVQTILTTTKAGQKMTENEVYPAVLKKLVAVAGLGTENIQGVFTADLDSNASITSAGGISGDDYDCTTRTWYSCTQTGETMLTKTYVAASTGKIILSAVTPVFDEKDTVVGVVGIDVGLDTVMNMMGNYTIGANGYSMLLTSDGTFVYHPNADLIDTMIRDMNISDSVSTAISNQSEQLLKYKVNGEQKMEDSKKQMAQMREAMDKIQESSKQVVGVIKAIEDIASQTNLLSLNASIEAARAGEAGKGFAVVAGEIGGLADESADAVNTTRNLINVSLDEIEKGNTIVNDVIASLDNAVERVRIANGMIQKTAQVADVQMKSIDQIRDGIRDMSQVVSDNSAMAEETSATSEELAAQSVTLNELVQKFELE